MLEFGNRLEARGHDVTFYLPEGVPLRCDWMRCSARIASMPAGFGDELDVVMFNHEPQWYLLDLFERASRRVFYALHHGALYGKEGSWEAVRTDVDLRLANSSWTADMVESEIGESPEVVLGGINAEHFRPLDVQKRYPLLCVGDARPWKGTDTIEAAAARLGLPLAKYSDKDLDQSDMAEEYAAAEIFVVGSRFEGFGQPGLEALACGTPLVTTDNGGCREYAIHEETALVVPPDDPTAMAEAIDRLRSDPDLAAELRENGLRLVADRFDWDRATADLERKLTAAVAAPSSVSTPGPRPSTGERRRGEIPALSIVVLAWDQLVYTQRCVESIRRHTDAPFELIIVDNGSAWDARAYAAAAGDVSVLNSSNHGFAAGMNQGLAESRGEYVAFLNNDTELPERWARFLTETAQSHPNAGIVVPAVTEARNPRTVRATAGHRTEILDPFEPPPAGVMYFMRTDVARELGGWGEEFQVASGEDVDLAFKVWVNDLDVVFDSRVLVDHVGKGTAAVKLPNWRELWDQNGRILLAKWTAKDLDVPRLATCPQERFERNLQTARAVAGWMDKYFTLRRRSYPGQRTIRRTAGVIARIARNRRIQPVLVASWRSLARVLPEGVRAALRSRLGGQFDRALMNQLRESRR